MSEGHIEVPGGRVWYERLGGGSGTPVLTLHGGPGAAHYYIRPFAERLAETRPVILYDQLGCGLSEKPDDTSLWTFDRFVAEVDAVREGLGLEHCHLFGQSWGGWLAIEYLCRGTSGVDRVILASTSASIRQFTGEARRLIEELPEPARTTLIELGGRGEYDTPEYQEAVMVFYRRHLCRLDPWPEAMQRTADELDKNQVYLTMNGPTEFDVIGEALRHWDRSTDLGRITNPTLVTCGRYDEITPACSATLAAGIPDARMIVFESSAHCAHLEETPRYTADVAAFLDQSAAG
jgi:proline-specific peptidase